MHVPLCYVQFSNTYREQHAHSIARPHTLCTATHAEGVEVRLHRNDSQAPGHAVQLEGHTSAVTSVGFSPDLRSIFSGCEDKTVKLWDIRTGQCIHTFTCATPVNTVSHHPSLPLLASGELGGSLCIWDVRDRRLKRGEHVIAVVDVVSPSLLFTACSLPFPSLRCPSPAVHTRTHTHTNSLSLTLSLLPCLPPSLPPSPVVVPEEDVAVRVCTFTPDGEKFSRVCAPYLPCPTSLALCSAKIFV